MEKILTDSSDFEELIKSGAVYIDKTELLEKIGPYSYSIFVRPPRFGKTLNMSMIKSFFEMNYDDPADKSKPNELFQNLIIMKNKEFCDKYMGEYPVISISLKTVRGKTYEEALKAFTKVICNLYKSFAEILYNSPRLNKEYDYYALDYYTKLDADNIDWGNSSTITNLECNIESSLKELTDLLFKAFGKHSIVIIDDFDEPLRDAAAYGYYKDMRYVTSGMGNWVLKTNKNLQAGILTCSLLIALDYGVDHLSVYESNYEYYSTMFGLTYKDAEELLKKLNLESHIKEVLEWYGGYNFAGNKMVCTESLLKYCAEALSSTNQDTFTPKNYRADAEDNEIIKYSMLRQAPLFSSFSKNLQQLLNGEAVEALTGVRSDYPEINAEINPFLALEHLFFKGYLTVVNDNNGSTSRNKVCIPNKEVLKCFDIKAREIFSIDNPEWREKAFAFKEALFKGELDEVQKRIDALLDSYVSVRDTDHKNFFHGFLKRVLSITINKDSEAFFSNSENRLGYADTIIDNTIESNAVIIEYKKAEKSESFEDVCAEALKQIEEKQYAYPYEQKNYRILKYGIGFYGKECWVAVP